MTVFVDREEQYLSSYGSRVLLWMFSGVNADMEADRKVMIAKLSENEYTQFISRSSSDTIADVFSKIRSTMSFPEVKVLTVQRMPHYTATEQVFDVSDNVLQEMIELG